MRIFSYYSDDLTLKPLELELVLWAGLPTIQFVGLAGPALRESAVRIKSAIKAAGFQFPVAQQIVVNLKPTHVRKTSRGLELAVALAYLWATEQVPLPEADAVTVYGELGLHGGVEEPADLLRASVVPPGLVITGRRTGGGGATDFPVRRIANLQDLLPEGEGFRVEPALLNGPVDDGRPRDDDDEFVSPVEARLLELIGAGGHHTLLAGPAGSGKSTLARLMHGMLPELTTAEAAELRRARLDDPEAGSWRPLIAPHASTPKIAMLGGGNFPRPGEIARAHRGLLLLDELLEYNPEVLESLRGPFETGELRVGRVSGVRHFPVDCAIVATTNLCPCGDLVPGRGAPMRCRYSASRCRSYGERLSGPLLDRFQLLHYPPKLPGPREVRVGDVRTRVADVQAWQRERGRATSNRRLSGHEAWAMVEDLVKQVGFTQQALPERRRLAALRVARSFADLEFSDEIRLAHLEAAMEMAVDNFHRLQQWQLESRG